MKYFLCSACGNIAELVRDGGRPLFCCGEQMRPLDEEGMIGPAEKHLPIVRCEGDAVRVSVAETAHPMSEEHYIGWIALTTDKGTQRKAFKPSDAPEAIFPILKGERPLDVYAFCNLHGLWHKEVGKNGCASSGKCDI